MRVTRFLAAFALCAAAPAAANIVTPPSYEELMAESTLVVIGTVTEVNHGRSLFGRNGPGATATLSVHHVVKGETGSSITVRIYHPVAELNPRCCEVGATYFMFLRPSARDGRPIPVWTDYAMVRIAGPRQPDLVVCPTTDVRSCPSSNRVSPRRPDQP